MEDLFYPSSDGMHTVHATLWRPQGRPRAILQIIHGMEEYGARYAPFAESAAALGLSGVRGGPSRSRRHGRAERKGTLPQGRRGIHFKGYPLAYPARSRVCARCPRVRARPQHGFVLLPRIHCPLRRRFVGRGDNGYGLQKPRIACFRAFSSPQLSADCAGTIKRATS